jgi:hypothetical protein
MTKAELIRQLTSSPAPDETEIHFDDGEGNTAPIVSLDPFDGACLYLIGGES